MPLKLRGAGACHFVHSVIYRLWDLAQSAGMIGGAMQTDTQRRTVSNYRKISVRQIVMRFYPNGQDDAIYSWIKSHENVNQYLKSPILDDMKKSG
jgi:hypothetical protein